LQHDVYFGEDEQLVSGATVDTLGIYRGRQAAQMITYNPGNLKLEKTYYWRIDEINQTDPNSPWKGKIWSFTMSDFIVVDDFEGYNSGENQIWYSWHDGLGSNIPESFLPGNGTGSVVGDETTPSYTEETIVHSGRQSMPFSYENNKYWSARYSESEKIFNLFEIEGEDSYRRLVAFITGDDYSFK